jgi:hypothetical protein
MSVLLVNYIGIHSIRVINTYLDINAIERWVKSREPVAWSVRTKTKISTEV